MKLEVWIWYFYWDDGNSVSLYHSEGAARGAVQKYVLDEWPESILGDTEMPGDLNYAVEMYFDAHDGMEWYHIEQSFVDLPYDLPQAPPQALAKEEEIVDLDPREIQAIISLVNTQGAANFVGPPSAGDDRLPTHVIDSIYAKLKS